MKYKFRLEADDGSGEFRQGTIAAESKQEAREMLERREFGYAAFRLDTEELASYEAEEQAAAAEGRVASPDSRSNLALHRQEKPYKVAWVKLAPGQQATDDGEEA